MSSCWSCGKEMAPEHTRCLKCGATRPTTDLGDLHTTPGAPLIRVPKRKRISSHDLVPLSLRDEYEQTARERQVQGMAASEERMKKFLWACATGAALTAIPMAIPAFLFMPARADAFLLTILDVVIGALAGFLTLRMKGGMFPGLVLFACGFAAAVFTKVKVGYPIEHQPVAIAVLGAAVGFSLLVAGFIGQALDEHE
ncbi:MAG: hypothetical protein ACAI25_14790 [Planctomycetota bacterium]